MIPIPSHRSARTATLISTNPLTFPASRTADLAIAHTPMLQERNICSASVEQRCIWNRGWHIMSDGLSGGTPPRSAAEDNGADGNTFVNRSARHGGGPRRRV